MVEPSRHSDPFRPEPIGSDSAATRCAAASRTSACDPEAPRSCLALASPSIRDEIGLARRSQRWRLGAAFAPFVLLVCAVPIGVLYARQQAQESVKPAVSASTRTGYATGSASTPPPATHSQSDLISLMFVFVLATFIGMGIIRRVSRLLHTPLMSLTNAISAIAVVGSIIVTGADYPPLVRGLGVVALFASMTNIVSGFLITDRMLKMFKTKAAGGRS